MLTLPWLVIWDLVLFAVMLAAGLALRLVPGKSAGLRRICGGRLMGGALLFLAAAPLDGWKRGVGILLAMAGTLALLTWVLVTVCRRLEEDQDP